MRCYVCRSQDTEVVIGYTRMAAMQSLIYKQSSIAKNCPTGEIKVHICRKCGAIFNGSYNPELMAYLEDYDNSQDASTTFCRHKEEMISYIFDYVNKAELIMEIGCGKGRFLRSIAEKSHSTCYGYDPSYEGEFSMMGGKLNFLKENYNGSGEKKYDLIILRHVIEHIQNPVAMFQTIAKALNENSFLYLETPNLEWILENDVIFEFTYEHCSYFTIETIRNLLLMADLDIVDARITFSGQYISLIAQKRIGTDSYTKAISETIVNPLIKKLKSFEKEKNNVLKKIKTYLEQEHLMGGVCLWGAAGKGVVSCNIFDPKKELIDCVVDISSKKQGGFIPMTAHPIISPEQLLDYKIKLILVTNSNYYNEIKELAENICREIKVYNFEKKMKEVNL